MTIRYRLLLSYIFISLTSSILIAFMFFAHFSSVLTKDIENDLKIEALSIMQELDWYLFERIQNILLWRNLEVMQDIQIHDIDKRLAYFLKGISDGYQGMYPFLFTLDKNQQLIATSNSVFMQKVPDSQNKSWQKFNIAQQPIYLSTGSVKNNTLTLMASIADQFKPGNLGYLHAQINWDSIYRILESPLPFQGKEGNTYTFLVDQKNTVIAVSSNLRQADLLYSQLPMQLDLKSSRNGVQQVNIPFLDNNTWLVSWSNSTGHRSYHGIGWKVVMMTPLNNALEPVFSMWQILLAFIILTTLLATAVSFWTAQSIAKPIVQLARFTRNYIHNKQNQLPIIKADGEIAELSKQFTLMITHLEKSQQDRVRMAKFAVIAEMAATMAHEIRTPLGILRSSAQMLEREKNLSPIAQEMLSFINSETMRLNELVTNLLESSRPRKLKFSKRSIIPVIEHAIELLTTQSNKKSIDITLDKTCSQDQLTYDWDQILQVFLNLIMNAIQHIAIKGRITISIKAKRDVLSIQISDDGPGISDSQKASIFEPFYTQRQEGIGLGLTVVQQMMDNHQGTISISDSQWGGACFTLYIPWSQENT